MAAGLLISGVCGSLLMYVLVWADILSCASVLYAAGALFGNMYAAGIWSAVKLLVLCWCDMWMAAVFCRWWSCLAYWWYVALLLLFCRGMAAVFCGWWSCVPLSTDLLSRGVVMLMLLLWLDFC
ncbi:hypothetical protein LOK49_Contig347G00003 [Camellia lanceoleosa]|nr:hypothetical protein LOK49_Contig347G00003 [Camellia lanceoleosa]